MRNKQKQLQRRQQQEQPKFKSQKSQQRQVEIKVSVIPLNVKRKTMNIVIAGRRDATNTNRYSMQIAVKPMDLTQI